jgi:hypothetical protein
MATYAKFTEALEKHFSGLLDGIEQPSDAIKTSAINAPLATETPVSKDPCDNASVPKSPPDTTVRPADGDKGLNSVLAVALVLISAIVGLSVFLARRR